MSRFVKVCRGLFALIATKLDGWLTTAVQISPFLK